MATVGSRQRSWSSLPHVVARCAPHHVPCVRCREIHPFFRKPNRSRSTGLFRTLRLSLFSRISNALMVWQQSDVVLNVTECGLMLVFHPVICRTLRRAIASFQASKEKQECYEWALDAKCPRKRIAWKNDMPHHRSIIYKTYTQIENSEQIGGTGRPKESKEFRELKEMKELKDLQELYEVNCRNSLCSHVKSKVHFIVFFSRWSDPCVERQFSRTAHELSVSMSCDEFRFAVFIAFCSIPVPIKQFSHMCREFVECFHFYPQLSARKRKRTNPALCDLKPHSSGRWNLAEPHSWSFA